MASHYEAPIRKPLVTGKKSYHDVTVDIAAPVENPPNKQWFIAFTIALLAFIWGLGCIIYTVSTGIGVWGLNKTVGWAWDITNFVWWVGIGHAGTLISAVLLLFRHKRHVLFYYSCWLCVFLYLSPDVFKIDFTSACAITGNVLAYSKNNTKKKPIVPIKIPIS